MAENWTVKAVDGNEVGADAPATPEVQETPSAQEVEQTVVEEAIADTPNVEIASDNDVVKVNLDQPPTPKEDEQQVPDEQQEQATEEVSDSESTEEIESPLERVEEPSTTEDVKVEAPVAIQEEVAEQPQAVQEQLQLPENVDKLVKFMEETGGSVEDYVNLNKDLSAYDDTSLIREYYKQKFPHLDDEDVSFKMDDQFAFDAEVDEERSIRSKKLAFKEELYNAKKFLEGNKEKYYADLVSRKQNVEIPREYQQAYETAKSYKQSQEASQKLQQAFTEKTQQVFNEEFKGFDFKVGESKFRYKVNEPGKVKEYQSDINNFVGEFLGKDGAIADAAGYHKAMFAAKNADKLAAHFYEQGRADAIKQSAADAKNIDMKPRQDMSANVTTKSGTKVRVVNNDGFSSGKLKFKNYNNR